MKRMRKYSILFLVFTAMVCSIVALTACGDTTKLNGISVENAETMFKIGDEFTYGEDFTVYANYSDGTRVDITQDPDLSIKKESGFDMNVPGDYQITLSYKKKVEVYTIYVSDFEPILRKIEADTADVKKNYDLGETVSFDGLKIVLTYENAQGQLITSTMSSLRNFDVVISNEKGKTIEQDEAFSALGNYTVTISKGPIKTDYPFVVDGINLSNVQSAIAVGKAFQSEVLSGTLMVKESMRNGKIYDSFHNEYTFGDNFLHTSEKVDTKEDCYYSMDEEGLFCVKKQEGNFVADSKTPESAMEGPPIFLWYMSAKEFGIENALNNLYEHAKECSNNDLKMTVNEEKREYSFSFSGLVFRSNNADYYETTVSFKLGEKYNVESATFTQLYYENNQSLVDAGQATPTFITDGNGITRPTGGYSKQEIVTVTQVAGERTETNPYSREMFRVASYDLVYDGHVLADDSVIECSMQNKSLKLWIQNVLPATADFSQDSIYLDYEGNYWQKDANFITCDGFIATNNYGKSISITLQNGGVWKLILTTANTRKTVTLRVTGIAPTSMSGRILNESSGLFYNASSKTLAINGGVTFYGLVNQYANDSQKAEITSANKQNAIIEQITVNGVKCFRFSATVAGTYTVKVTSTVASVSTTFTFTVNDAPDYESLLNGKYKTDNYEGVYELSFEPSGKEGEVSGKLTVTLTPYKEGNDEPVLDPTKIKKGVYRYSVDSNGLTVKLVLDSGTNFGIDLVMENGIFKLEDKKGITSPLVPVSE